MSKITESAKEDLVPNCFYTPEMIASIQQLQILEKLRYTLLPKLMSG